MKFTGYKKLSKKQKREMDKRNRVMWPIDPVTRVPKKSNAYDRNKKRTEDYEDYYEEYED